MENKSIDIINLIEKNPVIQLSSNYQNKFITKIQNNFDEEQQKLFVSSFYCYLNYNYKTDFIIEFDSVWKWLGFSRKEECKRVLTKHFTKETDYKIILVKKAAPQVGGAECSYKKLGGAGLNKEQILLNINTFKRLCLKSNTKRADEIHDYFIKMEEILQEVINDESNELKNQLIEKEGLLKEQEQLIKTLENKPETEGFYKNNGFIYILKDNANICHYKIGLSENPSKRINDLNGGSSTNSLELIKTFKTSNTILSEKLIHTVLFPHKIKKQKEWFYMSNEKLLYYFIKTIEECIEFSNKHTFNNISEELDSLNSIIIQEIKTRVECIEKCVQTDMVIKVGPKPSKTNDKDDKDVMIFNRFINDSCIIDDLEYISMRELVYQYKTWSKINSIFNYKDFEQYIESKFIVKKMFNKMFNSDMKCVLGINLNKSFYTFEFNEPFSEFENFLINNCVKVPTAKLNRSTLKDSYEKWCGSNNKKILKKSDIDSLCKFLDKYFFKDYFYEGTSSYHGWYGITIKENVLKGTGLTSTLCKKISICKVHKDKPYEILQEWDSQKEASRDLGFKPSTLKYRLDKKSIFNEVYYLKRKSDIVFL